MLYSAVRYSGKTRAIPTKSGSYCWFARAKSSGNFSRCILTPKGSKEAALGRHQ